MGGLIVKEVWLHEAEILLHVWYADVEDAC